MNKQERGVTETQASLAFSYNNAGAIDGKQKFAVFDIDGTVFRSGLYRELIFDMVSRGELPKKVKDEYRLALKNWQERLVDDAFNQFIDASVRAFEKHILDVPFIAVDKAAERVIKKHGNEVYTYTRDLIKDLRARSYFLIAISGSQIELVARFAQKFKFDYYIGQVFERGNNGFYTGKIVKTHSGKDKILQEIVDKNDLTTRGSIGVGDTRGDISMLEFVENPIAFNPDHVLLEVAKRNGWPIILERKSIVYELTPDNWKTI
jgi:Haloacid Dehalogenase superfamily, subfamily IB, phosphoserine phosphatase-like